MIGEHPLDWATTSTASTRTYQFLEMQPNHGSNEGSDGRQAVSGLSGPRTGSGRRT